MRRGLLSQFIEWRDSGARDAAALVRYCLDRIAELEPQLRAWVEIAPQPSLGEGPLSGIPFGAKDLFETRGLATEYGSVLYAGRKGTSDAALVKLLRERGATLLGKTQTTAFGSFDPAPTRNPCDSEHTPGGSSSGSAVAVAAGMVPFALGTQTQGSVIRPASFCGIVGFKPTLGLLPVDGALGFAGSLDTAGLFTATVEDMLLLWERMGYAVTAVLARRLGVFTLDAEPAMRASLRATVNALAAHGLNVDAIETPSCFSRLTEASRLINDYEGARTHEAPWRLHGDRIGVKLAALVVRGLAIPESEHQAALASVADARRDFGGIFEQYPVLLTPSAPGAAPRGLDSTGDPRMNAPWTALGVPAITVPMAVARGLPLGLQMTAAHNREAMLLATAAAVEVATMSRHAS